MKWLVKKYLNKRLKYYKYQCESLSQEIGCVGYIPEHEEEIIICNLNDCRNKVEHLQYVIQRILDEE